MEQGTAAGVSGRLPEEGAIAAKVGSINGIGWPENEGGRVLKALREGPTVFSLRLLEIRAPDLPRNLSQASPYISFFFLLEKSVYVHFIKNV